MDERDLEAGRAVDGRLFTAAQRSGVRQMLLGMVAICVAFVAAGSWPTWLGVTFVAVWLLEPPWVWWRLVLLDSYPGGVGLLGSIER